jgi:hypothetical protein
MSHDTNKTVHVFNETRPYDLRKNYGSDYETYTRFGKWALE